MKASPAKNINNPTRNCNHRNEDVNGPMVIPKTISLIIFIPYAAITPGITIINNATIRII